MLVYFQACILCCSEIFIPEKNKNISLVDRILGGVCREVPLHFHGVYSLCQTVQEYSYFLCCMVRRKKKLMCFW
jgi:hypothetical protein